MCKKQEFTVKKNAFVHKLYFMLSEPSLSHLIWWTAEEDSNTFALMPGKEFAKALTGYFKHGNVASFVRQLHMYGFHKVLDTSNRGQGTQDKGQPVWEFRHSSGKFRKNDESSLVHIKRRTSSNSSRKGFGREGTYEGHQSSGPLNLAQPDQNNLSKTYVTSGSYFPQPLAVHPSNIHGFSYNPNIVSGHDADRKVASDIGYPAIACNTPQVPASGNFLEKNEVKVNHEGFINGTYASKYPSVSYQKSPLEFRKIWGENDNYSRPRNPSLLFDPLAPAPMPASLPQLNFPNNKKEDNNKIPPFNFPRTTPSSFSDARESFGFIKDGNGDTHSGRNSSLQKVKMENTWSKTKALSLPATGVRNTENASNLPCISKINDMPEYSRQSLVSSNVINDKIRNSLIELHYGQSTKSSFVHHSLASQSSHNSIFSNGNSFSSDSTMHRSSLTNHPQPSPASKSQTSAILLDSPAVHFPGRNEPNNNIKNVMTSSPPAKLLHNHMNRSPPIKRKGSPLSASHNFCPIKNRASVVSPLSNEEASQNIHVKASPKSASKMKMSVDSLLGEG